jgi:gluconokinase
MKEQNYIVALDIGTTSTKGILHSLEQGTVGSCTRQYRTYFEAPGMAEQDPNEVLDAVLAVIRELVKQCPRPSAVASLVFGGILHSVLPVDAHGSAMARAMIWSDMRARKQCTVLREKLDPSAVHKRTGCPLHPLYLAPRLLWYREQNPSLFVKTVRFISIKEYVLHRLFGRYVVDRSVASGTGLMNIASFDWDDDLLQQTDIPKSKLSEIVDTSHVMTLRDGPARLLGLGAGTTGIIGGADGPLAHLGSVGTNPSFMSLTVGTSAAIRKAIEQPTYVPGTEAWCYYMTENRWTLGGVVHDAGNLFQWFSKHVLGEEREDHVFELLETDCRHLGPGSEGLYFLPFMSGERSPFYNPRARAAMLGMSFSHSRAHILRAMAEGIAFRIHSVYGVLDPQRKADLVLTGGILRSSAWMQITADFLGRRLYRSSHESASALGAALIAMRALEYIDTLDEVNDMVEPVATVEYNTGAHEAYKRIVTDYADYYKRLFT